MTPAAAATRAASSTEECAREIRSLMEGYATALAAAHLTPSDLNELSAINRGMRRALRALDIAGFSNANRAFHGLILGRCPNTIIVEQLRRSQARLDSLSRALFSREQGVLLRLLGPEMGQVAVSDHEALISALRRRAGVPAIERLTREHVLVHLRAAREELAFCKSFEIERSSPQRS